MDNTTAATTPVLINLGSIDTTVILEHISTLESLRGSSKAQAAHQAALGIAIELMTTIIDNAKGMPLYVRLQRHHGLAKYATLEDDLVGQAIVNLVGHKLLTKDDLKSIKALGYNVQLAPEVLDLEYTEEELRIKGSFAAKHGRAKVKASSPAVLLEVSQL